MIDAKYPKISTDSVIIAKEIIPYPALRNKTIRRVLISSLMTRMMFTTSYLTCAYKNPSNALSGRDIAILKPISAITILNILISVALSIKRGQPIIITNVITIARAPAPRKRTKEVLKMLFISS